MFESKNGTWVKWVHEYHFLELPKIEDVKNFIQSMFGHCQPCLKLDQCWFWDTKLPKNYEKQSETREGREKGLLHPRCHCQLENIPPPIPGVTAFAECNINKIINYAFIAKKGFFESNGYGIMDADWIQKQLEKQGVEKYATGQYIAGDLDEHGQRITILIELPRQNGEPCIFLTGWIVEPNGKIRLTTPLASGDLGKIKKFKEDV